MVGGRIDFVGLERVSKADAKRDEAAKSEEVGGRGKAVGVIGGRRGGVRGSLAEKIIGIIKSDVLDKPTVTDLEYGNKDS